MPCRAEETDQMRVPRAGRVVSVVATLLTAGLLTGCATTAPRVGLAADGRISVVAAENFWGSIAAQLGGDKVSVTSVVSNPDTDPHDYEPTPTDARALAESQVAVVNGVGYDPWAPDLLAANPSPHRVIVDVGQLVGVRPGGNPHRWYSPDDVHRVIDRITADYQRVDPGDAAYFARQRSTFLNQALAPYTALVAQIRARYAGTPIGASESIVTPLARGLGLTLVTPQSFLDAVSEGGDPTVADKTTVDRQIAGHQIEIYVFNSQNSTPDVQAQVRAARAEHIPVATVTETLTPEGATFQAWQVRQLRGIEQALHQATGK
jgi:zinc/manganese transport system substrate-binding protein